MVELIEKVPAPEIPEKWDFQEADKNFDELIFGWRRLTIDTVTQLWFFYNKLAKPGARLDLVENSMRLPSWYDWLKSKGIAHDTPLNHFKKLGWLFSDNVHFLSQSNEWRTPELIIDRTVRLFKQIDLDPCSDIDGNVSALKHFTEKEDGLNQDWFGKIYMNPPYGRELPKWTDKLNEEYQKANITEAIALVPSRTDTGWFQGLKEYPRCFIWGRLKFSGQENSAPFPSMAVYLGTNTEAFYQIYKDIGDIYIKYDKRTF